MGFEFRPAKREDIQVIVGLAGPSGSGKTYSGLRLCKGMAGGEKFAVMDTDNRRSLAHADKFDFDH